MDEVIQDTQKKTRRNKIIKLTALLVGIAVVAAAVTTLVISLRNASRKGVQRQAVLYSKEGNTYFGNHGGTFTVNIAEDSIILFSDEGEDLYFTAPSVDGSKTYDLFHCTDTEKSGASLLATGIENALWIKANGAYAVYQKKNASDNSIATYCYSLKEKQHQLVAANVGKVYMPQNGNDLYFTVTEHEQTLLQQYVWGKEVQTLAQGIKTVQLFSDGESRSLFYEVAQEDSALLSLYMLNSANEPQLVAENVQTVLYDSYALVGNLYFYAEAEQALVDWTQIISDKTAESDKLIGEPKRENYPSFFGISRQYNEAFSAYQEKLIRDEIRGALNKAQTDESLLPDMVSLYAYNGTTTTQIAASLTADELYELARLGDPKAVYRTVQFAETGIDLSELGELAGRNTVEDCITYAKETIKNAISLTGLQLAVCRNAAVETTALEDYDAATTSLRFSDDGSLLFSLVKNVQGTKYSAYVASVTGTSLGERQLIDTEISEYQIQGNTLWYIRLEAGRTVGSLYRWDAGEKQTIAGMVYTFLCHGDAGVLLLRNYDTSQTYARADLELYYNGSLRLVDESVAIEYVSSKGIGGIAYIKNISETAGGELYLYAFGNRNMIDTGVSGIRAF